MWNEVDRALMIYAKQYKKEQKYLEDNIQSVFDSISYDYSSLYDYAINDDLNRFKRTLEKEISNMDKDSYVYYMASNYLKMKQIRNIHILKFLIYLEYYKFQNDMTTHDEELFLQVIQSACLQAESEILLIKPTKKRILNLPNILLLSLLALPNNLGFVWREYTDSITKYNADELTRQGLLNFASSGKLNIKDIEFKKLLEKQRKRQINIHDGISSGAIENEVDNLFNQAKIETGKKYGMKQCRFIAEMDKKTTDMCESLNNQVFNLDEMNIYQRYSDNDKRIITYHTKGLIVGDNLPPISNHFHYCRSTITYNLNVLSNEIKK